MVVRGVDYVGIESRADNHRRPLTDRTPRVLGGQYGPGSERAPCCDPRDGFEGCPASLVLYSDLD